MKTQNEKKEKDKKSKIIHLCILIGIVVIVIAAVGIVMLKYQVEGETKLPFQINKIIMVSTAEGFERNQDESKWNFNIDQNNDIYISIDKNEQYKKNEVIKKITLENFQTTKTPEIGTLTLYKPEEGKFKNNENSVFQGQLVYTGSKQTNLQNLEIANQGGVVLFRSANSNIGEYKSNEEEEIKHDGTLLTKTGVTLEKVQYSQSFDIIIQTGSGISYKATITVDFPIGNLIEEGKSTTEKTNLEDIVFKRI